MADNVQASSGTGAGAIFATDADDSGSSSVHYPLQKIAFGPLNTFTLVSSANPFPVNLQFTSANTTALKVDGSAATQPVSGTVTANIGTAGTLALDATLTGGTMKTKIVDTGGTNVATVSAAGAVKVDGSAVTQPVSGTVTANAGTGNFSVVGTAAPGTASSLVVTVQGIASMTAVKVDGSAVTQPISGTVSITANSAVNVAQVNGVTVDSNSGNKSSGTQRVVIATDQPALTTPMPVQAYAESSQMTAGGTLVTPAGAVITATSSGLTQVVAGTSAKRTRIIAAWYNCAGAVNTQFQSSSGAALDGVFYGSSYGGVALQYNPAGWFDSLSSGAVYINLSAASSVSGLVRYIAIT